MALWDDQLHTPSFDGVEFPLARRRLSGGRSVVPRRYPYRSGQDVEDTGREPYAFELTIPLFAGVDASYYPDVFEALRAAVDHPDTTGEAEYVDPELGPLTAKVIDWDWLADSGARDGGVFTLKLEEVSHEDIVFSTNVSGADAEDHGRTLDEAVAEAGVPEAELEEAFVAAGLPLSEDELDYEAGELWSTQVSRFQEGLEDGEASAEDVADRVDVLRGRVDVLLAREELQAPGAVYAHHAAMQLAASLVELGEASVARAATLVEHVVKDAVSIYDISSELYGTPDRADEILRRNPSENPLFLPAGTRLVVLAA